MTETYPWHCETIGCSQYLQTVQARFYLGQPVTTPHGQGQISALPCQECHEDMICDQGID